MKQNVLEGRDKRLGFELFDGKVDSMYSRLHHRCRSKKTREKKKRYIWFLLFGKEHMKNVADFYFSRVMNTYVGGEPRDWNSSRIQQYWAPAVWGSITLGFQQYEDPAV